jgi:hypothetical protein
MTIAVYQKYPEEQIRQDAKETIKNVKKWFKDNPDRKLCRIQVWYGKTIHVKRDQISVRINKAADEAING